jgi:dCMP deaminase
MRRLKNNMELIIDNFFRETYKRYFSNYVPEDVLRIVNVSFEKYEPELVTDAVNIAKTSVTVGASYTECYDRIMAKILHRFPVGQDIDKFIVSVVVKVIIAMDKDGLDEFMRHPRDILREVAAKHFRIPMEHVTDKMVDATQSASDRFAEKGYSITDPPVESWDEYFYNVCRQVARNSKCLSRRIGAVLVREKGIISTGYNGPPRGVPRCDLRWRLDPNFMAKYKDEAGDQEVEGKCPRHIIGFKSGEGLEVCPAGHAERNALINAARYGICTKDTSLYMTCGIPCSPCMIEIINSGVREIIVTSLSIYDETSMYLINQSNVSVRMYDFIQ